MTTATVDRQKLYRHQALDRMLCRRCNDGNHQWCEGYECQCPCLDPWKPRLRVKRNRDGLSDEEREAQRDFPFNPDEAHKLIAEALVTKTQETEQNNKSQGEKENES